ncbi:MAG: alpha-1,4-glucan--maltose-1-phosphate maltosyltransferase [Actinomycetota bacterium]|nr:alpha-1,4-glucan--maltose-1-phosphate maltosyltransferase [Actinomycetota bacterium]
MLSRAATPAAPDDRTEEGHEGRSRVVIEGVTPRVGLGRYAVKRTVGEDVVVEADVFTDGHDEISCDVRWRTVGTDRREPNHGPWHDVAMEALGNDRWQARFTVTELGFYEYAIVGWVDRFKTWVHDLEKRVAADQDVGIDLLIGANLIDEAVAGADGADGDRLQEYADRLSGDAPMWERAQAALHEELAILMRRHGPKRFATTYPYLLPVWVDRERARHSAWYEMFPRSASPDPDRHGTLQDVIDRLPYVEALGFDVLYLPPIHPIGETARKGRDNYPVADEGDVGSPWAIGSHDGGHKSVHPELGTVEDVAKLAQACRDRGLELALDVAFQCSPDHPYVREHPEWFLHRPDGTIQYAENPPKKYQDIYPFDFETEDWQALWEELKSIFTFWIDQGVRVFRVDNPHTKPFPFWEWCITEIRRDHPDVIFLSEAFTRPKVMAQLAKLGFTQSYTYFAWRNDAWSLQQYFTELTQTDLVEYFRPNAWPNTPDILTEYLQYNGRPAFVQRLILAATLAANYGIYGPAFELQEHVAIRPGSEEYLHSEKYEVRHWQLDAEGSLRDLIARVNRIRRDHPALHADRRLHFHTIDNPAMLVYSKSTPDLSDVILCVVNTDPHNMQSGWTHLDLHDLGLDDGEAFQAHDLLTGARYSWQGSANFVQLSPDVPAHVFRVLPQHRTERDFATYR